MARLADLIDHETLEGCEIIVCDNVARYFYEMSDVVGGPEKQWKMDDFPNIAPPFGAMLFEWRTPKWIGKTVQCEVIGVLISAEDHWKSDQKEFRWTLHMRPYGLGGFGKNGTSNFSGLEVSVAVNSDGSFADGVLTEMNGVVVPDSGVYAVVFQRYMWPSLLAMSFMHCKNVELKTVIPSAPLSKKHQKKTGRPLVRYKVLEIEPMKKVLRSEGQSETLGLKHALHICRGHFKDYSKGGGLFGKFKGLYWWESHVRGDPSHGAVVKDYSVNPPTDTPT